MKKYLLLIFSLLFLGFSCGKEGNVAPPTEPETYTLFDIQYKIGEGDGIIDSTWYPFDTIYIKNNLNVNKPDTTIYLFEKVKDTIVFEIEPNTILTNKTLFQTLVKVPSTITNEGVFFPAENDRLAPFLQNSTFDSRNSSGYTFSITARTQYKISGKYQIEKTKASFTAICKENKTKDEMIVNGHIYLSKIKNQSVYTSAS